jgi:hypothetical protein
VGRLIGAGLEVDLPQGWDGHIRDAAGATPHAAGGPPPAPRAVAHLASLPLPPDRGDFGGGVVELMGPGDTFVALFEYGPESVGTALFAHVGPPRRLSAAAFAPAALQRAIPGQAGVQVFFTANQRAFCLYVVLGSFPDRHRLVPTVNHLLETLKVGQP